MAMTLHSGLIRGAWLKLKTRGIHWLIRKPESGYRYRFVGLVLALSLAIGVADYVTGFELSFLSFYVIPVCLAVPAGGWRFGVLTAVFCIALWLVGDFAAGALYPSTVVPLWNALIALSIFLFVIWLLSALLALHRDMEERVRLRTNDLRNEISEREYLEKVVIEISDRERRSIGHDLHDGLGQHLTGTALVTQSLAKKAAAGHVTKPEELRRIAALVEEAIDQSRKLAKGLLLAEIEDSGLIPALEEVSNLTSEQYGIRCEFTYDPRVRMPTGSQATHLYRIAQEAVRNAVRHGAATRIVISLIMDDDHVLLSVRDNGSGLPPPERRTGGIGLRLMAHRAGIIGAQFRAIALHEGGTSVECRFPLQQSSKS